MSEQVITNERLLHDKEIYPKSINGMLVLLLNIFLMLVSIFAIIWGALEVSGEENITLGVTLIIVGSLYFVILGPIIFFGLKILRPNEALVLTLFGKYYGTLKGEGFYFVNPFVSAINPVVSSRPTGSASVSVSTGDKAQTSVSFRYGNNRHQNVADLALVIHI